MTTQAAKVSLDMFKHWAKQWPHKQHQYNVTCLSTGLSNGHKSSISITACFLVVTYEQNGVLHNSIESFIV